MNSKEKDEYVNQTMERMTSMEPYYCNPFDNPKELKERASDLLKQLNSLGDNAQEEKESIMRQLFGTYNKLAFPGDGFKCDYGFNIHFHGLAVINYNVVMLDTSPINIGAGAFIAPGVCLVFRTCDSSVSEKPHVDKCADNAWRKCVARCQCDGCRRCFNW